MVKRSKRMMGMNFGWDNANVASFLSNAYRLTQEAITPLSEEKHRRDVADHPMVRTHKMCIIANRCFLPFYLAANMRTALDVVAFTLDFNRPIYNPLLDESTSQHVVIAFRKKVPAIALPSPGNHYS